jgi:3-hydroxyisobutyrate dehydrogenase
VFGWCSSDTRIVAGYADSNASADERRNHDDDLGDRAGTGLMGAGMAGAGHDVTVWNRTPEKAEPLAGADGIKVVENLHEALGSAEFVMTMLFDADAVTEVMRSALPKAPRHTVRVQTSTVGGNGATKRRPTRGRTRHRLVDAPVLGTREPAEQDNLIVLAAGDTALRERVAPVLDAIGSRTIWVGERPGDGHRLKLVANSWVLSVTPWTRRTPISG